MKRHKKCNPAKSTELSKATPVTRLRERRTGPRGREGRRVV